MARHIRRFIATASAIVAFALIASAAMAQSYTGNWPATITKSQRDNGKNCVSLTDDGSYGWPHSGPAELNGTEDPYGAYFTVIEGLMTVTFISPSGEGDCCDFFTFTAPASDGHIGKGAFNYFGPGDNGIVTFGKKNACNP